MVCYLRLHSHCSFPGPEFDNGLDIISVQQGLVEEFRQAAGSSATVSLDKMVEEITTVQGAALKERPTILNV